MKNILILCTGNSCRSILAQAYINHVSDEWLAYSAGSHPTGEVHPMALETLTSLGINASYARSKNWDEFAGAGAPIMDVIATVCDSAAGETCPVWPGHPTTYHWPFPDPAKYSGSEEDTRTHFREVFAMIKKRIDNFLACEG
ncbi:MAG: arsenate reductase ArsC [Alphaproteobacteria bacterium]|nr:arsenate reductase ArsC [Alphaproteobacteria bacterium]